MNDLRITLLLDNLEDDQALWVKTPQGLVVIAGCAHAGLLNTLYHVRQITKEQKMLAVIGGFHLTEEPKESIALLIWYMQEMGVQCAIPLHCTGVAGVSAFKEAFGKQGLPMRAGEQLNLEQIIGAGVQ